METKTIRIHKRDFSAFVSKYVGYTLHYIRFLSKSLGRLNLKSKIKTTNSAMKTLSSIAKTDMRR